MRFIVVNDDLFDPDPTAQIKFIQCINFIP